MGPTSNDIVYYKDGQCYIVQSKDGYYKYESYYVKTCPSGYAVKFGETGSECVDKKGKIYKYSILSGTKTSL